MQYKTFLEYIKKQKDKLKKQHTELSDEIINQIAPKEFIPNEKQDNGKGILLIHGMLDSSASMNSLYDTFSQKGYHVKNVLLPGHGTTPKDLLNISYKDWLKCVEFALKSFNNNVKDLTVIGLSAGAILSCYLAQNYPRVNRLVLFAPAFKLRFDAPNLIKHLHKFNKLVPPLAIEWLISQTETSAAKYKSVTTNCVHQLNLLTKIVKSKAITCPIFTIISTDDETVSTKETVRLLLKQKNKKNKLIIYNNGQIPEILPANTECIASCIPAKKILNFSHVSMHISPDDPIYGASIKNDNFYLGALNVQNKLSYVNKLQRLTYNPYYEDLLKKILVYISNK